MLAFLASCEHHLVPCDAHAVGSRERGEAGPTCVGASPDAEQPPPGTPTHRSPPRVLPQGACAEQGRRGMCRSGCYHRRRHRSGRRPAAPRLSLASTTGAAAAARHRHRRWLPPRTGHHRGRKAPRRTWPRGGRQGRADRRSATPAAGSTLDCLGHGGSGDTSGSARRRGTRGACPSTTREIRADPRRVQTRNTDKRDVTDKPG